jgi:hypothetical protein
MKRFRLSTLMLLIVIAALVAALVVERQRGEQIARAHAIAKINRLWDDPTVRNLRSGTEKSPSTAKLEAANDQRGSGSK